METVATEVENTEATGTGTQDMEDTEIMANAPGIMGVMGEEDIRTMM